MKRSVIGMFCVLALLFSCGLPAAADTTAVSSEVTAETESDEKAGEVWMVLGIFTVTAVVTASAVIIPKWRKIKSAQKQKTDSEEQSES
ncbi:MAG: hypothetical protein MRZ94_00385 [Oscillospiraceae bacterium]|nr:hypothetical protein [Oscillospiraceae bacterium]